MKKILTVAIMLAVLKGVTIGSEVQKVIMDISKEPARTGSVYIDGSINQVGVLVPTIGTSTIDFEVSFEGKMSQTGTQDKYVTDGGVWHLAENSGSSTDVVSDSYTLTCSTWTSGLSASCIGGLGFLFEASKSEYLINTDTALCKIGSGDMTFAVAFKHDTIATLKDVILNSTNTQKNGYWIDMESDGDISFNMSDDSSTTVGQAITTAATYDDNEWHRLVCIKDNETAYIYIDGGLVVSSVTITTCTVNGTDDTYLSFMIGADSTTTNSDFDGYMDGIIFEKNAWSSTDVVNDYNYYLASKNVKTISGAQISSGTGLVYKDISDYIRGYKGWIRVKAGTAQTTDRTFYFYLKK